MKYRSRALRIAPVSGSRTAVWEELGRGGGGEERQTERQTETDREKERNRDRETETERQRRRMGKRVVVGVGYGGVGVSECGREDVASFHFFSFPLLSPHPLFLSSSRIFHPLLLPPPPPLSLSFLPYRLHVEQPAQPLRPHGVLHEPKLLIQAIVRLSREGEKVSERERERER